MLLLNKTVKLPCCLILCLMSTHAPAHWQLYFEKSELKKTAHNQEILSRLDKIIDIYPADSNPELRFDFHHRQNSSERWHNLTKQIPKLKGYSAHIYNRPDTDRLSIYLVNRPSTPCPVQLILTDPNLPLPDSGLTITGSANLFISTQGQISIPQGHGVTIFSYDYRGGEILDLSKRTTIYFNGDKKTMLISKLWSDEDKQASAKQLKETLSAAIEKEKYQAKAMSLSAISAAELTVVQSSLPAHTCFIQLHPLLSRKADQTD